MNTTNNTILISGGSAGIGFEMAKLLSEKGNNVIITGRDEERLQQAAAKLKNVKTIVSDVSNPQAIDSLVAQLYSDFPQLNMVINNADRALVYDLVAD
ncbi:MAG: SDR family NAD(P)-dependent oxidoreductase, partial [Pedobacter sp.]